MTTVPAFPNSSAIQPVDLPRALAPLVPTWLWRLTVVASAAGGVGLSLASYGGDVRTLPVAASLLVAVTYTGLAVTALAAPRVEATLLRGMLAVLMVVVAGVHSVLLTGDYSPGWSVLVHAVTPALVVADYVLLARGPIRLWHPIAGLVLPAAYLVAYRQSDPGFYGFLEPGSRNADLVVPGLALVTLGGALVLGWLASLRAGRPAAR
ncbi:hypothetical protein NPS01_36360 [Nocardioides psychrotolerans]|uniref:FAR-17a/AIG1-like protein n=1 Tax=Nocardioides psychrotolerans TaxID=1005945 RepID=A0A1I3GAA9_9ACTN|nr:hypothetical protein [Nocardioides psychrotolerans]GEP39973.1 hypothetical protein NPS01_36360 [Nocardioides psychrotolerans]SFI20438.1 hypothetical protein SAMN05216561_10652 [Nocardioides psychrotolerans]